MTVFLDDFLYIDGFLGRDKQYFIIHINFNYLININPAEEGVENI